MTTKCTINSVTRETGAYVRERGMRPLIATLHGSLLLLRPKGLRSEEVLDLGAAWSLAVKQRVARERAEKVAARKARRAA
jgi:hypothetical protein